MNQFVLDNSITMSWCFEDESNERTESVLAALEDGEAVVPRVWALEVVNTLLVAERKRRVSASQSAMFLKTLGAMSIREDAGAPARPSEDLLTLARETGLTSYDASYLELAIRSKLPLATLDAPLRKAAKARGVSLLPAD